MTNPTLKIVKILCTTQVRSDRGSAVQPFQTLSSPAASADSIDRPLNPAGPESANRAVPLQVAECDDGLLRLYFDGQPLWQRAWPVSQIDDCISCFLATSHSLRLGEALDPTGPQCSDPATGHSALRFS